MEETREKIRENDEAIAIQMKAKKEITSSKKTKELSKTVKAKLAGICKKIAKLQRQNASRSNRLIKAQKE